MSDLLTINIEYNNQELEFPAELKVFGYTHKISVTIDGREVLFEPDEERNYRALVSEQDIKSKHIDVGLLQAIAAELESSLK